MPGSLARRRLPLFLLALATASAVSALAVPATAAPRGQQKARQIAAQAYVYGEAMLQEQRVIGRFPANTLISITQLADPTERLIPAPNVDTLYTTARLDLTSGPLILHVPEEHGRYYTFQFMDAYTNSFAYVGRRTTGTHVGNYAVVGPGWHGHLPSGVKRITAPTPTVWVLGRTLVKSAADVARVNAIQHEYSLTPLSGYPGRPSAALYLPRSPLRPVALPTGLAFFDAMDAAMASNRSPASARALLRRFASVGIAPGRTVSTEHLSSAVRQGLLAGLKTGRAQVNRYQAAIKAASERRHNGWLVPPAATGNYGTNYLLRAYISQTALGANVPAEAEYPFAFVDHRRKRLRGTHRYVLHFAAGELPPVKAFWSLTMYDQGLFLIPNALNRYAIGDRTPGLRRNRDGSLDIVIQHTPPNGSRSNWLPAPAGRFALALRLYQPKAPVLRRTWPLPTLRRVG
jgi:hypothetical protein